MSFFNALFPDDCRLCEAPLQNISRIPVCPACLALPKPFQADFFCASCRTAFANDSSLDLRGLCPACRQDGINFDTAYAFGNYQGALRDLIHLYKYAKVETLSQPLSRLLIQAIPSSENFDLVIAMPMHWRKLWQRGFNQAELLAEPVARRYGLKLAQNLRRKRLTQAQAGLSEQERRNNLKDSFSLRRPEEIRGKRILLIDDVMTTGTTLRAATAVLKRAGAARVTALTLARVDQAMFFSDTAKPQRASAKRASAARAVFQSSTASPVGGRKSHAAGDVE